MSLPQEARVYNSIIAKFSEELPNYFLTATQVFSEEYGEDWSKQVHLRLAFIGVFFLDTETESSEATIDIAREYLELSKQEKHFLNLIEDAVIGYFTIKNIQDNVLVVVKQETSQQYRVHTIDLDTSRMCVGDVLCARLVKGFNGKYFFFGSVELLQ